jgi:hypothetical protein
VQNKLNLKEEVKKISSDENLLYNSKHSLEELVALNEAENETSLNLK